MKTSPLTAMILIHAMVLLLPVSAQDKAGEIIIDESGRIETISATICIDSVWAGHPVGFCLLTSGNRQYIAYYNSERRMVVGQRDLDEDRVRLHVMPATYRETARGTSTVLGWDSHNSVTMGIDKDGFIHLSGNMHVNPLTYFRSTVPFDITTLKQEWEMVGSEEDRCTYPHFMLTREGELLFHYRDGASGSGNEIYNIYNTSAKKWTRLLDTPLTDGQGLMNAYQTQPVLREDNWYHVFWVWRDTPDCSTNHDLSYMKSPDLKTWFDPFGNPVKLPATIDQKSLIVDPIPVKGGIINLAARLCLDESMRPVFVYHKYDQDGNLQLYTAKTSGNEWVYKRITDWDYRWEFSGGGSIVFEVLLGEFRNRGGGFYEVGYSHVKYGAGTILLDRDLDPAGRVIKPDPFTSRLKAEGGFPGLGIRTAGDLGDSGEEGVRYVLKWETLPANRDRARPEPWPSPSGLFLYKLKKVESSK
jgi:hypothetical protein